MPRLTGKELAEKLSDYVNATARQEDDQEFVDTVLRDHRTLQQSTMRLFMKTIKAWSEVEYYDLRNEATIMLSRKIVNAIDYEDRLPFI